MRAFESNIINIYGEKGKEWLSRLPYLVKQISSKLGLHNLNHISNLSYNYVLSGFQEYNPIILKLGVNREELEREAHALRCFAKHGAVKVLDEKEGFILIERAVPGISLKSHFLDKDIDSVDIVVGIIKKLNQTKIPESHCFSHIKDLLLDIDRDCKIPSYYLNKARKISDNLLKTSGPNVLLHGDLHHDNILQNDDDWVVIDPKGFVGESAFEVGAYIRNPIPELLNHPNHRVIINNRLSKFSDLLGINRKRLKDWSYVQAILAACWAGNDLDIAYYMIKVADILDSID